MRINKYLAQRSSLSRRAADAAIAAGRVLVNGQAPVAGQEVTDEDRITIDGQAVAAAPETTTIILNKPRGYVCSRQGQGSQTIYDLLPPELRHLNPVGRLDKDSSGLLLMTNDGNLAQRLTHPSYQKQKVYQIELDRPLAPADKVSIEQGVELEDGPSHLALAGDKAAWTVTMHEGRNRQIRRTFGALGYTVTRLHRTDFGDHQLGKLNEGNYEVTNP